MPLVAALKPVVIVWASLNAIDDLSLALRLGRPLPALLPGVRRDGMCELCDDVMGDLLKGAEGLEALPCGWACLRVPACVKMCEAVRSVSRNSSHSPCVAAGYCEADDIDVDVECELAPPLRCVPSRYCQRVRSGLKLSCVLRPGIGRWLGMRNAVGTHAAALAGGLLKQPRCGEAGAGPYCVASPRGVGAAAEAAGHVLSLLYGGVRTVSSIESPGGDDDRQWLTFWLILTILLFVERWLARVVLSTFPLYYEAKLGLLYFPQVYKTCILNLISWHEILLLHMTDQSNHDQ